MALLNLGQILSPLRGEDPFHRFVRRCGSLIKGREGLYDILRLDPSCQAAAMSVLHERFRLCD
jgi:hypothetical protein